MSHYGSNRFDLISIDRGQSSCICMLYIFPKVVTWRVVQMKQWGGNGSLEIFENLRVDLRWLYGLERTRRFFCCFSSSSLGKWEAALWLGLEDSTGRLVENVHYITLKVIFLTTCLFLVHINNCFFFFFFFFAIYIYSIKLRTSRASRVQLRQMGYLGTG